MIKKEDRFAYSLLLVYYFVMIALALIAKGTGDDGDSIYHFVYAKYAFAHPENFINQWAKPVYVLLAAPFAQFGFTGIKIFNVTVTTLAIFFTYRIAQQLRIKNKWFVVIALCSAPMYIRLSLSGLTEPLFALAFAIAIFLALRDKLFYSALLTSLLPFMRSEGLIILCVYCLYLLFRKKWRFIPLLAVGHIVYSMIGWFYYKDFLWVFNTMPYAVMNSVYGSGSALNFIYGLVDYIGIPLVVLFCFGTLAGIIGVSRGLFLREQNLSAEELWLIYGGFFSIWISHMVFWEFGLFNSMGLIRVLIAVVPCAGIICLRGFNMVLGWKVISSNGVAKKFITALMVVVVLVNPFLQLKGQCAFDLSGNQESIFKAAQKYGNRLKGYTIYDSSVYSSCIFGHDLFDSTQHRWLQEINTQKKIPAKSAIVWDDFYAANESKVALSNLLVDDRFELLDTFQSKDCQGYSRESAVLIYVGEKAIEWMVKDTLYKNDFESGNFNSRDSLINFSGKYSCAVDEKNPYSPAFSVRISSLAFTLPARLRVGAMFYAPVIPFDHYEHALLVASLEHDGKSYFWEGLDIDNVLQDGNTWRNVSFDIKIPAATDTSDVLNLLVWNPQPTLIYMDNFFVEHLEQKQK